MTEPTSVIHLLGDLLYSRALALATNIGLGWEGLPGEKHSSLLQEFVNYGRKTFMTLPPGLHLQVLLPPAHVLPRPFLEFRI